MVIFTLVLLDVETESENWDFLKYGRIGKHPMQSLYTRYYRSLASQTPPRESTSLACETSTTVPCDIVSTLLC